MHFFELNSNFISTFKQHEDKFNLVTAATAKDKKVERDRHTVDKCSIMDLIVLLIAKENMPVRIVESPYFTDLLEGKCVC